MLGVSNLDIILDEIRLLPVQELVDIKVFGQTIAFLTQRSASDRHEKDSRKALMREGREKGAGESLSASRRKSAAAPSDRFLNIMTKAAIS